MLRLSPRPVQPFCHTPPLERNESIYVNCCYTVTAFSANSYCRDRQLSWLRFTSEFKLVTPWFSPPFPFEFARTTYLDSSAWKRVKNQSVTKQVSMSACTGKMKESPERCIFSVTYRTSCTTKTLKQLLHSYTINMMSQSKFANYDSLHVD